MNDTSKLKLESISIKDLKAFQKVQRIFTEETEEKHNVGILSNHNIELFKELVFNFDQIKNKSHLVGLAHDKTGKGYVSFKFDCDYYKRITLTVIHKNYDESYFTFRVRDRVGSVKLNTKVEDLQNMINEFILM